MIIDSHVHCFPPRVAAGAVGSLESTSFLRPALDGTADDLLCSMKRSGIDYSVVLPIATTPRQVESCNKYAAELAKNPSLRAFGTVHPKYDKIKEQLRFIKEAGLFGVKLHPDFQGEYIDSPDMVGLMYAAAEEGLMIYLHGGMDISFPEINRCTPKRLARVLPQLRGAKIICAHLGGYGYLDQSVRFLADTDVIIDTSAVLGYFPGDQVRSVIRAFGAQRVLFGTDSPWCCQAEAVSILRGLGLDGSELELIEWKNSAKLFNIT